MEKGKEQGCMGKIALSSFSPHWKTGEGGGAPTVAWAGGPGASSVLGKWGKGRGSRDGLFPPS